MCAEAALGKAIFALSGHEEATVGALGSLHRFTEHTVVSKPKLLAELAELADVEERGWAITDNERYDGVRTIAVPIIQGADTRAALGVQGPAERLPDARLPGGSVGGQLRQLRGSNRAPMIASSARRVRAASTPASTRVIGLRDDETLPIWS